MRTTEGCTKTITKTKTNKSVDIRPIRVISVPINENVNDNENQQSETAINQRPEGAINRYEVVLTEAKLL